MFLLWYSIIKGSVIMDYKKICPECGKENIDIFRYCVCCGVKLNDDIKLVENNNDNKVEHYDFCPNCGKKTEDYFVCCSNCGIKFDSFAEDEKNAIAIGNASYIFFISPFILFTIFTIFNKSIKNLSFLGLFSLIGIVLMIYGRVKYPKNHYLIGLMWRMIALIFIVIYFTIFLISLCDAFTGCGKYG